MVILPAFPVAWVMINFSPPVALDRDSDLIIAPTEGILFSLKPSNVVDVLVILIFPAALSVNVLELISLLVNSLNIDSQGYIGKVFTQASREQIPQPTGIFSNSSIYKATGIKDGDSDQLLFIHPVTDEAIYKPNLVDISIPAQGDGGSIFISANQSVSLIDGGKISASTFTKGNAGLIDITADKIIIDHNNQQTQTNTSLVNTGIFSISNPGATGNAGNINLTSHDIQILNNARIFTGTLSSGNAGIISIITGNLLADNNAYISSDTSSTGNAGHINLDC